MSYAENTTVSAEKSRAEIEETLRRYGADSFGYMTDETKSMVMFKAKNRTIRIMVPKADGSKLKGKKSWKSPTDVQRSAYVEQENRRRWRALLLVIKAKLEAVATGIALFEDEFLAYTVMPNGETFGEWAKPQIAIMAANGQMPKMLMAGGTP